MRIHIGKISPALADKIDELEKRLDRYGKLNGKLSLHKKPYGDFYFAFVDMDIDQKQYGALRTAFNGVMFRQSKLELKIAKPSPLEIFQKKLSEAPKPPVLEHKMNAEQVKRAKSVNPRRINVFPGRYRDDVRENPTFRNEIDGRLRKVRMKKRKMWGVERRPLDRLVDHFEDGEWRDSENRAVEIIAELHDEHARDQRIADDFVKNDPGFLSDSDFEDFKANARELAPADYVDNDIEIVSNDYKSGGAGAGSTSAVPGTIDFGAWDNDDDESVEPHALNDNVTESLRSVFSAPETPFTLFGGTHDDNDDASTEKMEIEEPTSAVSAAASSVPVIEQEPKVGLFFPHKDSPYLRSQSQASKLVAPFDHKQWEEEFYSHRGEWNRELRQRQRDALRKARRMGKKRGE